MDGLNEPRNGGASPMLTMVMQFLAFFASLREKWKGEV
jgi:hypothetical protein